MAANKFSTPFLCPWLCQNDWLSSKNPFGAKYVQVVLPWKNVFEYYFLFTPGAIFGKYREECILSAQNLIILWIKYYMFKTKFKGNNLSLFVLKNYLIQFYQTEKYQQISEGLIQQFHNRWESWIPFMES